MGRILTKGVPAVDEFSAFKTNMVEKMSGLVLPDDFSVTVFYNKTLDNPALVSIGEYGTTGSYWIQFTPDKLGFWEVEVYVKSTKQYWFETYDVLVDRDPGSNSNHIQDIRGTVVWNTQRDELVAMAWLNDNGRLLKTAGNCFWDFYDSENTLLFSLTQLTPFPSGIYRAKRTHPAFNSEENYYYVCKINDGISLKESALGFITII